MARRFAGGSHFWSQSSCRDRRTLLSSDEIVPASLGELYRYRLAVQEQLIRVDTAIGAMRAKRDRIEKDEWEHVLA